MTNVLRDSPLLKTADSDISVTVKKRFYNVFREQPDLQSLKYEVEMFLQGFSEKTDKLPSQGISFFLYFFSIAGKHGLCFCVFVFGGWGGGESNTQDWRLNGCNLFPFFLSFFRILATQLRRNSQDFVLNLLWICFHFWEPAGDFNTNKVN